MLAYARAVLITLATPAMAADPPPAIPERRAWARRSWRSRLLLKRLHEAGKRPEDIAAILPQPRRLARGAARHEVGPTSAQQEQRLLSEHVCAE
ncbi:MAG: hypothetical protein M3Y41_06545 [Pseudomonadota bacterium]|nr:hypothetical protein [Pseudomonadota bacterium]